MNMKPPTVRLLAKYRDDLKLKSFPSSGPKPNISYLRRSVYGTKAYLILCGTYVYNVDQVTYHRAKALMESRY